MWIYSDDLCLTVGCEKGLRVYNIVGLSTSSLKLCQIALLKNHMILLF